MKMIEISFAADVRPDWHVAIESLIDQVVFPLAQQRGSDRLVVQVQRYGGGQRFGQRQCDSGNCVKIITTIHDIELTHIAGFDGRYWHIDKVVLQPQVALPKQRRSRSGLR